MWKFKNYKLIYIIIFILSSLAIISFSITYLVNSGKTKADSMMEDNHYQQLDELKKLELEEQNSQDKDNITSFIDNISSFFISTTYANNNENTKKKQGNLWKEIKFEKDILKLLEKYYILSKLDLNKIPKPVFNYWRLHRDELPMVLNSYDYLNHTHTLTDFIKLKKEFKNKKFYENTIKQELILIITNYFDNKQKKNNLTFLPKDINDEEWYKFMINWLKNHKYLINVSKQIGKKLDFDYRLTLAAILTEQFRYNGTYRWYIKKYLKSTPFLFSMTKWSYGVGWIKEFTGKKIIEDAKKYWFYKKVFSALDTQENKKKSIKTLLQDPYWESVFPNVLIANIIKRWELWWHDIKDKPWVILTLYNFWNNYNKNPHAAPKIWGAIIKLNEREDRKYSFGWLAEALYYYIKVYNLY